MSARPAPWSVELPHDPWQKLAENLWRVEGALPHFGMRRVMTVVRLEDQRLLIHSAIALEEPAMAELEAWGTPAVLLVPHVRHRMDAGKYRSRYPGLQVLAPRPVQKKAREVVDVDGVYEDFEGDGSVSLRILRGVSDAEGALLVRSEDGATVVLNELVFDLRPRGFVADLAMRALRMGPGPRVTPIVKLELVRDRKALRSELESLADTPRLERLIVSHERLRVGPEAAKALRTAAATV